MSIHTRSQKMAKSDKPNFYAILPSNVRYDKDLTPFTKLIYAEINSLANKSGVCWANDKYFQDVFEVSRSTITRSVSQLRDKGYINITHLRKEGSLKVSKREMSIASPMNKGCVTGDSVNIKKNIIEPKEVKLNNAIDKKEFNILSGIYKKFYLIQSSRFPKIIRKDWDSEAHKNECINTLHLLKNKDDFTYSQISETIKWAVIESDFWGDKLLSIVTLRKKSKNGSSKFQNIYHNKEVGSSYNGGIIS